MAFPGDIEVTLLLCDSVEAVGNKLYVLGGGWSSITTSGLPCVHPRIGIAAVIRVPWTETNKVHEFRIGLQDEDGRPIALGSDPQGDTAIAAQFSIGRPPTIQEGEEQNVPIAVNVDRQVFLTLGTYTLVMDVDGVEKGRLPFRVNLQPGMRA